MNVVKLGKKGQVSIPKRVIEQLGLSSDQMLLVETTADGAVLLRPAGLYPLELYDDERIRDFLAEDEIPAELAAKVRTALEAPGQE